MTYQFKGKLKDCSIPLKLVILFGPYGDKDQKNIHILITNNTKLSAQKVIDTYRLRWRIEDCFRELKDFFMLDQYQVRKKERIERHWALCHLAWTLAYWVKQNGYLRKTISGVPKTFTDVKQALNNLICYPQIINAAKNPDQLAETMHIKSKRVKSRAG